jgi:ATP-dependent exoDNAse (exonuclease V) beta subunit
MQRPSFSIYDASAGSGKTYALVKEYLKIILSSKQNDAYRNILAITFTNKAVHEMKSRIVGSLSEFTKDEPSTKANDLMHDLSRDLGLSIIEIKSKSQQIIKHIIHNYAAFDISTIDKFTHKVIRAFAHDLGLPMTFEVTLDTENLLTEAVDAIIAEAGNDEVLTKLLIDFTMEKTDDDKSWDISREILDTGRLILNENNRNEISHFENKKIEDFIEIKAKLHNEVKVLEVENVAFAKTAFSLIENNSIDLKSFSRGTFPNHIQFIIDNDVRANKYKFTKFEDVAINKTAKDSSQIEAILPEILNLLSKVYINNEKKDFYKAFLKNITPLSLLNTISDKLKNIQQEQNVLSIAEFNALIHNEIQNQPAPFIYERLGERYRHFFIDEFQDTSEMQWQNLIPLIDNATSSEIDGEKGTLMIVGDPKQSIYRWRGGKAEQFIELSKDKNPFNNPQKVVTPLYQNYRSYSKVIEFNNELFQMLSSEFDNLDYKDLYKNHVRQETNSKVGGFVNISFLPKLEDVEDDSEEENLDKSDLYVLATLNTIQNCLKQGFEYKDIVILTRKRSQGIAIANYLTEQKIPLLSSETLMIANATEVRLIIHILKYLQNSNDLDSKANFLHYLSENAQNELPIHDFIAKGMSFTSEFEFEKWLEDCNLNLSFSNIRKKSLYEAVEIIISKFLNPEKSNAYVQYFLDIVLERDISNQAGISDFLNYWDKNAEKFSIPSPEGTNAVRIMTIHKSKGLEFPVVIFPFAEEDYNRKPKSKLWLNADSATFGLPKVLIDNSKAIEGFGSGASEIYNQKKQEELLDNINVLYVALTRAEEQLFIISAMNLDKDSNPRKNNMSSFFIKFLIQENLFDKNQLEYEFGDKSKLSITEKHIDTSKTISLVYEVLNSKNIKIAQRESLMWGTHQQEAIEYGNVVHEILSYIKFKTDVELAIIKAVENGLITTSQKVAVEKSIQEIVNHEDLKYSFSGDIEVLNEQTIIQKEAKTIKPDRMVISKNKEVHLLDYKTGLHQAKYKLQLENYQIAIEKMGYKVTKKSLIYIGEQIEVVNL